MNHLNQPSIFRCEHVNLREGITYNYSSSTSALFLPYCWQVVYPIIYRFFTSQVGFLAGFLFTINSIAASSRLWNPQRHRPLPPPPLPSHLRTPKKRMQEGGKWMFEKLSTMTWNTLRCIRYIYIYTSYIYIYLCLTNAVYVYLYILQIYYV